MTELRSTSRYCAFCGAEIGIEGSVPERFGEAFCSDAHAEEFVRGVRAARVAAAIPADGTPEAAASTAPPAAATRWSLKQYLKVGACCGLPLLALVVLAGGGGVLLGAAGAALPLLALLACPLAMFFMMRGMAKTGQADRGKRPEDEK